VNWVLNDLDSGEKPMTSLIKQAGSNISTVIKNIADNVCADGSFCESVGWTLVSVWIIATMWLSLAQL